MSKEGFLYQTIISTTPEKLWAALTNAEFTRQYWFGRSVESDWRVGSAVTITTPEGAIEVKGKVLAVEVNKRLSYTWGSGTSTDNTTVVFEITQMGPLCKLLITHDIDLSESGAQQAANGWTFIALRLEDFPRNGQAHPGNTLEEVTAFKKTGTNGFTMVPVNLSGAFKGSGRPMTRSPQGIPSPERLVAKVCFRRMREGVTILPDDEILPKVDFCGIFKHKRSLTQTSARA